MSKSLDHDFHVIHEEDEEKESTMSVSQVLEESLNVEAKLQQSQIITKPEETEKIIKVAEVDLKKITELVNKQTLKGYKAGYEDGFESGSQYNDLFSFSLGVSLGITITAVVLMFSNK